MTEHAGKASPATRTEAIHVPGEIGQDAPHGKSIGATPALAGRVEAIHIAPVQGAAMRTVTRIRAQVGSGLDGDRYALGLGHYSHDRRVSRDLTLIEAEVIEDLAAQGIRLAPGGTRRNVTTRGIPLNQLVGRRFRIGAIECLGTRLCEPCVYLAELVEQPLLEALLHRGGLRADVLVEGHFAIGDAIMSVND
jgi:MOSC domain-containing protein YiiM